jgi:hypothetical protein
VEEEMVRITGASVGLLHSGRRGRIIVVESVEARRFRGRIERVVVRLSVGEDHHFIDTEDSECASDVPAQGCLEFVRLCTRVTLSTCLQLTLENMLELTLLLYCLAEQL